MTALLIHENQNVYRVTFNLVVHGRRESVSDEMVVTAPSVEMALAFANEEKKNMRRQAVHRELAVRSVECIHEGVTVLVPEKRGKELEEVGG